MTRQEALELLNQFEFGCDFDECTNGWECEECCEALNMAIEALEQEPIIYCEYCKYWHEWENGTGSCRRSDIIWVGTDYDDFCSFGE